MTEPSDGGSSAAPELVDESRWTALYSSLVEDGAGSLPPILGEIISRFAPTSQQRLDELRAALRQGRTNEAEEVLHALRGGSAMLGAARVEQLAGELEQRLGDGLPPAEAIPLVAALESACADTARTLMARVGAPPPPASDAT